jgi:hypothetical protein
MGALFYLIELGLLLTFLAPTALLLVLNFEEKHTPV